MVWRLFILIFSFIWAFSAQGKGISHNLTIQPVQLSTHFTANSLVTPSVLTKKIAPRYTYKQLKYSKKSIRYQWLKEKKPKVLSYYNSLNRIVFYHNFPPVHFISKPLFSIPPVAYDQQTKTKVDVPKDWTQHTTSISHRLGGWKESNTLYKGSLSYETHYS